MRAAIFNPYLDTLGGGERYTASFVKVLVDAGWSVSIGWQDPSVLDSIKTRFGIDLTSAKIIPDIKKGDGYDLCFWVSDGSIPTLRARRNFLHFQVPFHHLGGNNLLNKMKLIRVDKIICNSLFTKKVVDKEYGVESTVVYPPVDVDRIRPKRKENFILSVARFSQLKQNKGQEVLVRAFKKMVEGGLKDWKLILAGGVEVGVGDYIEILTKLSGGYPIEIVKSPDFKTLKDLYGKAKIFWSASGFAEDEEKNPEKVEHFGITAVEAMAGGVVPLLFSAGGHKEIVTSNENGVLWTSVNDLVKNTRNLISDQHKLRLFSGNAKMAAQKFSYVQFEREVKQLL